MPTTTIPGYESTTAPSSIEVAEGNLGKRSSDAVFAAAYAATGNLSEEERATGATRATELDRQRLLDTAKAQLAAYAGENAMFPEYRRNFVPGSTDAAGTSVAAGTPDIYLQPRNKTMSATEVATLKLGTPYSPTVGSPGSTNKLDPNALPSIASITNGVVYEAGSDLANKLDPDTEQHQTRDAAGSVLNRGQVRKFKLGVASSATTTMDPEASRGQFPNVT